MARNNQAARIKYLNWKVSEHRRKLKLRAIAYKGGSCETCGYNKCPAAMVFHHKDPSLKEFRIGGRVMKWEKAKKELDKTVLLCGNCHAELHFMEDELLRRQQESEVRKLIPARDPNAHGASRYSRGCRCTLCRSGHAARCREYKHSRVAKSERQLAVNQPTAGSNPAP